MTKIVDIFDRYMGMSRVDRDDVEQWFVGSNTDALTIRNQSTSTGGGANFSSGNVNIDFANGISLSNPDTGATSIHLDLDGDALFGSNTDNPAKTALAVFANNNVYNRNAYGAGDLLVGDDSAGKGNMWWDASEGKLFFRSGTTTSVEIGDGGIIATWGKIGGWNIGATTIYDDDSDIVLDSSAGTIKVGSGSNYIYIDGTNDLIKSSNFQADAAGWQIDEAGDAEFNNITARGTFRTSVFSYENIVAVGGKFMLSKSATEIVEDVTMPVSGSFTLKVDPADDGTTSLVAVGDVIRSKGWNGTEIVDVYATVTSSTTADGVTELRCTLNSGSNYVLQKGMACVNYGPANSGLIFMQAGITGTNIKVLAHSGTPWVSTFLHVNLGNMRNTYNTGSNNRFGIGIGDYTSGNYLSYNGETANKFVVKSGDGAVSMDSSGIRISTGSAISIHLDEDGDAWFGSDISAPATTSFAIFSTAQTYNTESMGAGDIIMGDNSSSKANVMWDKSAGKVRFRTGKVTHTYIGTDGALYGGGGTVKLDNTGLKIEVSGIGYEEEKSLDFISSGDIHHASIYAYEGGAGANTFYIIAEEIEDENNNLSLIAQAGNIIVTPSKDFHTVPWTDYSASSTVTGWTSFTSKVIEYKKIGKLVFVNYNIRGVSGGTGSNTAVFSLPFAEGSSSIVVNTMLAEDNTVKTIGYMQVNGSSAYGIKTATAAYNNWTTSGYKRVQGQFWYETT